MSALTPNKRFFVVFLTAIFTLLLWGGDVRFYLGFANDWFSVLYFAGIASVLFWGTILTPSGIIHVWEKNKWGSLAMIPLFIFLFSLTWVASIGVVKEGHQAREAAGEHSKAAKAELDALELQESLLAGAKEFDLSKAPALIAEKQAEMDLLRSTAAGCMAKKPPMKTNCRKTTNGFESVEMLNSKAVEIRGEIEGLKAGIDSAKSLVEVSQKKASAHNEYANAVTSGGTGDVAPVFITIARWFNVTPAGVRDVQIVSSMLVVQLALAGWYAFLLHGISGFAAAGAGIPPAQVRFAAGGIPVLHNGGDVLSEGMAVLDKGEKVLTPEAVQEIEKAYPGLLDKANAPKPKKPTPANTGGEKCVRAAIVHGLRTGELMGLYIGEIYAKLKSGITTPTGEVLQYVGLNKTIAISIIQECLSMPEFAEKYNQSIMERRKSGK